MRKRMIVIAASAAATAALAVGGVAWATSGGDEAPLSGDAKTKAVEAALAHVGGGTVLETEAGDDGAGLRRRDPPRRTAAWSRCSSTTSFAVTGSEGDDDTKRRAGVRRDGDD